MTPAQAKSKMCPFLAQAMATTFSAIMPAMVAHPKHAEKLSETIDRDDKNCRANGCMMWDNKRRDCGMKGGAR